MVHQPALLSLISSGIIELDSSLRPSSLHGKASRLPSMCFMKRFVMSSVETGYPHSRVAWIPETCSEGPYPSISPYAGDLASPHLPLGKSSQVASRPSEPSPSDI